MKKRIVGLLLSFVLSFVLTIGLVGCGNSAEQKQETNAEGEQEETQETEQEETKEDSIEYDEFEYFYAADIYDSDKVISCNLDDLSNNEVFCGDWTLTNSIDLYLRREGGVIKVGYTKENIPINAYAADSEWIQLLFENEEQPFTFMFIKVEDFLTNSDYDESKANNAITEETPVMSEEYIEQDKMYNEAIALFDENKTYTIDEYIEVITKMLEVLGKKSNAEVASDFEEYIKNKKSFDGYWVQQVSHVFDFENIEETLENTESLINLLQHGKDGRGGITEFYIVKGESSGQEAVVIYYKTEAAAMEN